MERPSTRGTRGRRTTNNNENAGNIDPVLLAALNQAVANAVAQSVPQAVATALLNNPTQNNGNGNADGNAGGDGEGGANANAALTPVLLERFQKQKPDSFRDAPTPIEAENWIAHLEKIFDVLETTDNQKVRLAAYKMEGDAQRWWKALKNAQGEGYVEALAWRDFLDVFYEQYFPESERDAYRREYFSMRQKPNETITAYMIRFIRVAGIAGAVVGSAADQAERFKWGLLFEYRRPLINDKFSTVAEVANAARNLELERADFNSFRSDGSRKRGRDNEDGANSDNRGKFHSGNQRGFGDRSRGTQSRGWQGQGSYRNGGNNGHGQWQGQRTYQNRGNNYGNQGRNGGGNPNRIPITPCAKCGGNHPGRPCYRETGACFTCGQTGHKAKDCTMKGNTNQHNGGNSQRTTGGRVFAMTAHQAAEAPGNQG